jgi:alanine-glyoxylate transaminase/(R)-3-amino-2-methylpropionate-pyruvate transaminase
VPSQIAGVKHAASPYCYRCPFGKKPDSCNLECAKDIEDVIQTTTTGQIAGFLAEPIQGVGGFITPHPEYFKVAVEIIRAQVRRRVHRRRGADRLRAHRR